MSPRSFARSRAVCVDPTLDANALGLQEGDHREDAPVGVGGDGEAQLLEDAGHVLLDAAVGEEDARRDRRVVGCSSRQSATRSCFVSRTRRRRFDWVSESSRAHARSGALSARRHQPWAGART